MAVVVVDVHGPEHGPVPSLPPQDWESRQKLLLRHLAQDALAEVGADLLELPGHGGVLAGEVGVVRAAVDDAKGVAGSGEVEVHPLHHGVGVVLEVDGHHAAHRAPHLVQQAAGLAEVDVLRVLPHLGKLYGRAAPVKEEVVHDFTEKDLKGGAGAEPAPAQHTAHDIGVEPRQVRALPPEPGRNAPDDGGGGVALALPDVQAVQLHHHRRIPLALHPDDVLPIEAHRRDGIQINARGQDPAMLVVGMVAADLGAPRRGEDRGFFPGAEALLQPRQQVLVAALLGRYGLGTVQRRDGLPKPFKIGQSKCCPAHSILLNFPGLPSPICFLL